MLNSVTLMGYVATEIEHRSTNSGKKIAAFRLRHPTGRKERNSDRWESKFYTIEGWERQAERIGELQKGQLVAVTGRLDLQTFGPEGNTKEKVVITVTEVHKVPQGGGEAPF